MPTSDDRSRKAQGHKPWFALAILILAVLLLAIDATVLYLAVPALTKDLSPSATQLLWIGDIYSFALAGLLIVMGNVADRFGRKRLLLLGSVGFAAASVVAAFATSAEMLIAARVLLGISGATIMPSTLAIIRHLFPDSAQRTRAIALWAAGATAGEALGPLVGGALLEHFWWGSVFLINVPVMAVLLIGGLALLPESKNPNHVAIDLASAALSFAMIVPAVYAIKHGFAHGFDWQVPVFVGTSTACGIAFVVRQQRIPVPLIDVALFKRKAFTGAVLANAIAIFAFSGLLFFFSQYLQLVRGYGTFKAGLAELPATLAALAVIFIVGIILQRLGRGRAISLGLVTAAGGLLVLAATEHHDSYLGIGIALALIGMGIGVAMTLSTDAVVESAPANRSGAASSISETGYELGIALGIAILGSLHSLLYRRGLDIPVEVAGEERAALRDSLATASGTLSETAPVLDAARDAFTTAMQFTSVIAAIGVLAAAAIAWRIIPSTKTPVANAHGDSEGAQ